MSNRSRSPLMSLAGGFSLISGLVAIGMAVFVHARPALHAAQASPALYGLGAVLLISALSFTLATHMSAPRDGYDD